MKQCMSAIFGFTAGNFIYQALGDGLWGVAAERSYFQAGAILIFWFALSVTHSPQVREEANNG